MDELFAGLQSAGVARIVEAINRDVAELPFDQRVQAINEIRAALHSISPFASEPVDFVRWVKAQAVRANDYNPNSNRYRTVASGKKGMHFGKRWTTEIVPNVFNLYPIYDWHVSDIWRYHALYPDKPHNEVYDRMHLAGLSQHQMRLCQPYGDDQKRGLWLYHLIEPQTWGRVVARVNGANSGALYVQEKGDVMGYGKITLPPGHTWRSFSNLLLATMPDVTRNHYLPRIRSWLEGWHRRGYRRGIPDEAPRELEKKFWAPSWRRIAKTLLRLVVQRAWDGPAEKRRLRTLHGHQARAESYVSPVNRCAVMLTAALGKAMLQQRTFCA